MNKTIGYLALLTILVGGSVAHGDLVVSGVFDGPQSGGEPKVVELYAINDVDLSQYAIGAANNGGGSDGVETNLSGMAAAGSYIYVIEDNNFDGGAGALGDGFAAYFGFTPAILFDGSGSTGAAAVNGNDAIEVFFDSTGAFTGAEIVVDTFGDINTDGSGEAWEYLDGWAYRNNNIGKNGSSFNVAEWTFSGINANDGQSSNGTAVTPFPIGTYTFAVPEPSTAAILSFGLIAGMIRRRR